MSSSISDRLRRLFHGSRPGLPSFDQVREQEGARDTVERGTCMVPLERIVGTVGRYNDFDAEFRPRRQGENPRLQGIIRAMREGREMPPISLYQIKDDFFVLDGHHRLLAARELGRDEISACIVELLPSADTLENRLYLEKVEFRDRTGLPTAIELTEPDQFVHFEQQIRNHAAFLEQEEGRPVSLQEAARDWYRTIYLPLYRLVENSQLQRGFPGRTIDDLCLYISRYQWEERRKRTYGIGIDRLIPRNMEEFRKKMAAYEQQQYPEMKRDITIFVLLNVEGKHEQRIMDKLFALEEVQELHSVHGSIDMVVKARLQRDLLSSDAEVISQFTHSCIRPIRGVKSTQTLIPGLSLVKE